MKLISKKQVISMHQALTAASGGSEKIRDEGLLDSALHAPFQTFSGTELYPSVLGKACRLGYGLIRNHPFVDGNKRIGTHVMFVFLLLNGIDADYQDQDLIQLIMGIASGTYDDTHLLAWMRQHMKKI